MGILSKIFNPGNVGKQNLTNREKWLQETLSKIPAGAKILDAGAGELKYKRFCFHLNYVSQDFGQYNGSGDNAGLQTQSWDNTKLDIVSDITSIPVEDASFDAVMCIEVLEHLPDPVKALYELNRVLKPGGVLILTAPFCSLTHFSPYHFSTGFNKYFYERHLQDLKHEIIDLQPNGNYFEYLAQEIRRSEGVAWKYAAKTTKDGFLIKLAKIIMLGYLNKLSQKGNSSAELLCFGYQVLSRKN